jgi:hypothetical protein
VPEQIAAEAQWAVDSVAVQIGTLLAKSGGADVVDGHVALLARRLKATVVTSDPDDLVALDSNLELVVVQRGVDHAGAPPPCRRAAGRPSCSEL